MLRLLTRRSSFDHKKRRNRGRNRDGGVIAITAGFSSFSVVPASLFTYSVVNPGNALLSYCLALLLGFFGVAGYLMQSRNRMTRLARIGLVVSVVAIVCNSFLLFSFF